MTFIDISQDQDRPSSGLIAGYSILCAAHALAAYWAVNLGRSRLHYRSFFSVRVLFPLALFILALENAALAASGQIYDRLVEGKNFEENLFIKAIFVLQPFEVPILLVVIFELTYLVHKRRSVNFCGMYFDEGVRVKNTAFMSFMLRNSIRTLATVLLVMGLVVNFNLIHGVASVDEHAGRAGWWALWDEDWAQEGRLHLILSLIPTAVLTLVSFYLSIMLWRYGTESAMVVHSSMCNPWSYSFFGTLAMAVGQIFDEKFYTVMSNAGMLIFVVTILLLMAEVDKDIVATNDVACFLVQVAQKGDQIRVARSLPSPPSGQHVRPQLPGRDGSEAAFCAEEKAQEDDEAGGVTVARVEGGLKASTISVEVASGAVGKKRIKSSVAGVPSNAEPDGKAKFARTGSDGPTQQPADCVKESLSRNTFPAAGKGTVVLQVDGQGDDRSVVSSRGYVVGNTYNDFLEFLRRSSGSLKEEC